MPLTTVTLKAKYPYIFALQRDKGRAHGSDSVNEATVAHKDGAPADVLERTDFDRDAPGLNIDVRMRAVTEEAEGNAFCVFHRDGTLRRVWWRVGVVRNDRAVFDRLQLYAEQFAHQAARAIQRV
jgi:hypothetical protein